MKWGREDLSSPTEYKGDYSLHLSPGRGGTEDFWGAHGFLGDHREDQSSPIEYKRVYSLYLSPGKGGIEDFFLGGGQIFGGFLVFREIEGRISRRQQSIKGTTKLVE